jgi:hypothetical protein
VNIFHEWPWRFQAYLSSSKVLKVGGEPLIEPEVTPPLRADDVAEPLVCQFVRNNLCGQLNLSDGSFFCVNEQETFAVLKSLSDCGKFAQFLTYV